MMNEYADSTVALTIYNLLCVTHGAVSAEALFNQAVAAQHPGLEREQSDRAIAGLLQRGWILNESDFYRIRDTQRRVVVDRERSQVEYDKGEREGGWSKWMVRDPKAKPCNRNGTRPIDEVMSEVSP